MFFEKDVPYYACNRDFGGVDGLEIVLYSRWNEVRSKVFSSLSGSDVAIITSYCPDSCAAYEAVFDSNTRTRLFYDMDTPVTLGMMSRGKWPDYIMPQGLADFDMVLSYTAGSSLVQLQQALGAARVSTLFGCVDPEVHCPTVGTKNSAADLSYLGTYASDRQVVLNRLFFDVSLRMSLKKFCIAGALYPTQTHWGENVSFLGHIDVKDHPSFYCSSRFTLNVTRADMASCGYCPSARIFEAASCGVPVISDKWQGIDLFLTPGTEILLVSDTDEVGQILEMDEAQRSRIAKKARERVLCEHTASKRAEQLEGIIEGVCQKRRASQCGG